jgi:hypothetical protein
MIMELLMTTAAEAANLLRVGRSGVCRQLAGVGRLDPPCRNLERVGGGG